MSRSPIIKDITDEGSDYESDDLSDSDYEDEGVSWGEKFEEWSESGRRTTQWAYQWGGRIVFYGATVLTLVGLPFLYGMNQEALASAQMEFMKQQQRGGAPPPPPSGGGGGNGQASSPF